MRIALVLTLALGASALQAAPTDAQRYAQCLALARSTPLQAIQIASAWRIDGGGIPARHCLGVAYSQAGRFAAAATVLEQAARAAEAAKSPLAADLWGQAGNAALAADAAEQAYAFLNAGLSAAAGLPAKQGGLLIDRARALVALARLAEARDDLDNAVKLAPQDPAGWLLQATLARREGRFADAETSVAEAARLAPQDADVALEQGNIAAAQGKRDVARAAWSRAAQLAPDSPAGTAAKAALRVGGS